MEIRATNYLAGDIVKVTERGSLVGGLPFCRHSFSSLKPKDAELGGAGLYACFYREKLIYIGKYLGVRDDWRNGDIVSLRWIKHLGTFTMQARNLGFSKRALSEIEEAISRGNDYGLEVPEEIINGFQEAKRSVLQRETGCMTTFQRFMVSMDVWQKAGNLSQPDLSDFEFVYSRIEGEFLTAQARKLVSSAEKHALEIAHPPGNTISGRRQTPLPDPSGISELFAASLSSAFPTATAKFRPVQSTSHRDETSQEIVEPEENMSKFETMIEDAPSFAQEFVSAIEAHFAEVNDADIEFTNTADMRVRKLFPHIKRGFRNCVRFEWQPRQKRFLMYSQLSDSDLQSFGLSVDRVRSSDVLSNITFLSEPQLRDSESAVLGTISKAHSAFAHK